MPLKRPKVWFDEFTFLDRPGQPVLGVVECRVGTCSYLVEDIASGIRDARRDAKAHARTHPGARACRGR